MVKRARFEDGLADQTGKTIEYTDEIKVSECVEIGRPRETVDKMGVILPLVEKIDAQLQDVQSRIKRLETSKDSSDMISSGGQVTPVSLPTGNAKKECHGWRID